MDARYPAIVFPVIDEENGVRLFDSELVDYIAYENDNQLKELMERLVEERKKLEEISVPGFRFPNPAASVEGAIGYHKNRIAELEAERAAYHANPPKKWADFTFREKVEYQLGFVAPMPYFKATPEEMKAEAEAYDRYVNRITAEAEIVQLWLDL